MAKVILDMAISMDGFLCGKDKKYLYPIDEIRNTKTFAAQVRKAGAVVMDKYAYDMAKGNFTGYEYQLPIFVSTPEIPLKVAKGENEDLTFTFVTEGIKKTISLARKAAKDKNVMIVGWVEAAQHSLKLQLVDEIMLRVMPVLIGKGTALFSNLGHDAIKLKTIDTKKLSTRVDFRMKVIK